MSPSSGTSLLIRCSREEATKIRNEALRDHRSVSSYLLYLLERNLVIEEKYTDGPLSRFVQPLGRDTDGLPTKDRTAVHLRCSFDQADRIRRGAAKRQMSISSFVVFALRRSWKSIEALRNSAPGRTK